MEALRNFFDSSPINDFMLNTPWAFPAAESLHFMGLTLLLGALMVVDLRGMGLLRVVSFEQAHKLIPLAIVGFGINLFTGFLFLFADPRSYFANAGFWYKMAFIVLAGINALVFEIFVFRRYRNGDTAIAESTLCKVVSALSLVFWFTVLILGRFLPYTEY